MNVTIRHRDSKASAMREYLYKTVTPSAFLFVGECYGTKAYVCRIDGKFAGVFSYAIKENTLIACGTYVRPKYRQHGLAMKLWGRALKRHKPKRVSVTTVSRYGHALISRLRQTFNIEWSECKNYGGPR